MAGQGSILKEGKNLRLGLLAFAILAILSVSLVPRADAAAVPNAIPDPGFENLAGSPWSTYVISGNGTVNIHSNTNPHSGHYSALLSAVNRTLQCVSECKDTVRAMIAQNNLYPTLNNIVGGESFSAWWYVAPSSLPPYALHIQLTFTDGNSIEYWYGRSDLSNQRFNLGPIPAIGSWFLMSRNLQADIQGIVPNPATTKIQTVSFGAYGGSYQDCPPPTSCPSTPHGEAAWLDDVSLASNTGPVAVFSASPSQGSSPLTVAFDGSPSYESISSSRIAVYQWSFGDGGTGTSPSIRHTFTGSGTFNVTLTVVDANGLSSASSSLVRVGPASLGDSSLQLVALAAVVLIAVVAFAVFRRRRRAPNRNQARRKLRKS